MFIFTLKSCPFCRCKKLKKKNQKDDFRQYISPNVKVDENDFHLFLVYCFLSNWIDLNSQQLKLKIC